MLHDNLWKCSNSKDRNGDSQADLNMCSGDAKTISGSGVGGGALRAHPGADGSHPHCAQGERQQGQLSRTARRPDAGVCCPLSSPAPQHPDSGSSDLSEELQGDGMFGVRTAMLLKSGGLEANARPKRYPLLAPWAAPQPQPPQRRPERWAANLRPPAASLTPRQ